ncbi:major facilitator superfamily domain-containing protein 10 isoform X3 [Globicephala melas]|uniref:major facilitator superfamily domain-containing protein 10 isoform X3 n=1 Tax=Globicephala melas TaxID=9731 RepID=UPI00387364F1
MELWPVRRLRLDPFPPVSRCRTRYRAKSRGLGGPAEAPPSGRKRARRAAPFRLGDTPTSGRAWRGRRALSARRSIPLPSVRPFVRSAEPAEPPHAQPGRIGAAPIMGWGAGGSCTPRPPIHQQPAPETRVVAVVFLGLLLDLLAFTLLLPLLPALLESHGRAQDPLYGSWQRGVDWFASAIGMPAEKRYNSVLFGGLIGSIFCFLQFLSAPLTGAISDCLGRRPVMLLSLAGLATSYAVWATSKSFAAFLASRMIGGISKGNVSLSTAIVADLGSSPARSRGMAVIGVAFSLAFTLGPMLGASLPVETAPWLALLFAVSDLLFICCFLPETLPPEKRAPSITLGFRAAVDLLSPLALLCFSAVARGPDPPTGVRLGSLRLLGLVYFLYLFLFSGLEFTLSFLVHQRFQFSRLSRAEGCGHGHAAKLGRPGQGSGAHGGRLSVLAGRGAGLLHRVRGALPAPLLPPAEAETGSNAQGRVAEPRLPQSGAANAGSGRPGPGRLPTARLTPPSPPPSLGRPRTRTCACDTPVWTCLLGSDSETFQAFCSLVFYT